MYTPRSNRQPLNRAKILHEHFGWRHEIRYQIVNPDIDGLLTACLLHKLLDWEIVGFYDNMRAWVDMSKVASSSDTPERHTAERSQHDSRLTMQNLAWVDCDMVFPDARCLSQHVVCVRPTDVDNVKALSNSMNPNLFERHSQSDNYNDKYPAGTFQWAWWLLLGSINVPRIENEVRTGLAWMPDGAYTSITGYWQENVKDWFGNLLPGNVLKPLIDAIGEDPSNRVKPYKAVREAAATLRTASGVDPSLWPGFQFSCTLPAPSGSDENDDNPGPEVVVDPGKEAGREVIERVLSSICQQYGWETPTVPAQLTQFTGRYKSSATMPPSWPDEANRSRIVSLAVTEQKVVRWTTAGTGSGSLANLLTLLRH